MYATRSAVPLSLGATHRRVSERILGWRAVERLQTKALVIPAGDDRGGVPIARHPAHAGPTIHHDRVAAGAVGVAVQERVHIGAA